MSSEVTALYRYFDSTGRLLYVGISLNAVNRLAQHSSKPWAKSITRIEVQYFESRELGLEAEVNAIRREHPMFNIVHSLAARPRSVNVVAPNKAQTYAVCSFDEGLTYFVDGWYFDEDAHQMPAWYESQFPHRTFRTVFNHEQDAHLVKALLNKGNAFTRYEMLLRERRRRFPHFDPQAGRMEL